MAASNGLKPTAAAEWRKPRLEGVLVTLPYSMNVARLRPVALDMMITSGKIPDILTQVASSTLFKEQDVESLLENPEMLKNFMEIFSIVVPAAFMEPEVVPSGEEPGEGQISLDDIDYHDKMFVFNYATAGARALYLFREQQVRNGEVVPDGKNNGVKAKRVNRAK